MSFFTLNENSWDGGFICTASQMLLHRDKILIYYRGTQAMQGQKDRDKPKIGVASLAKDRFVSLEPKKFSKKKVL